MCSSISYQTGRRQPIGSACACLRDEALGVPVVLFGVLHPQPLALRRHCGGKGRAKRAGLSTSRQWARRAAGSFTRSRLRSAGTAVLSKGQEAGLSETSVSASCQCARRAAGSFTHSRLRSAGAVQTGSSTLVRRELCQRAAHQYARRALWPAPLSEGGRERHPNRSPTLSPLQRLD